MLSSSKDSMLKASNTSASVKDSMLKASKASASVAPLSEADLQLVLEETALAGDNKSLESYIKAQPSISVKILEAILLKLAQPCSDENGKINECRLLLLDRYVKFFIDAKSLASKGYNGREYVGYLFAIALRDNKKDFFDKICQILLPYKHILFLVDVLVAFKSFPENKNRDISQVLAEKISWFLPLLNEVNRKSLKPAHVYQLFSIGADVCAFCRGIVGREIEVTPYSGSAKDMTVTYEAYVKPLEVYDSNKDMQLHRQNDTFSVDATRYHVVSKKLNAYMGELVKWMSLSSMSNIITSFSSYGPNYSNYIFFRPGVPTKLFQQLDDESVLHCATTIVPVLERNPSHLFSYLSSEDYSYLYVMNAFFSYPGDNLKGKIAEYFVRLEPDVQEFFYNKFKGTKYEHYLPAKKAAEVSLSHSNLMAEVQVLREEVRRLSEMVAGLVKSSDDKSLQSSSASAGTTAAAGIFGASQSMLKK